VQAAPTRSDMKTSNDPRHIKRKLIVQELFKLEFHDQKVSVDAGNVIKNKKTIDQSIQTAAPDFPVDKINRIDLAILRLAGYELLIEKKVPKNVVIDEAVELAKEFGGDTSPAFINGVLAHIISYDKSSKI
jgi:transcription antitermination protein NusB